MDEKPDYGFSKDKLPRAFSYPLKRSLLNAALDSASVREQVYSVHYIFGLYNEVDRRDGLSILDALFSGERTGIHDSVYGKSLIRVWAVPCQERKACEETLILSGLPILCEWLKQASLAENVWRGSVHVFKLHIKDGLLKQDES